MSTSSPSENKSFYEEVRKRHYRYRSQACAEMETISQDRLEKIENGRINIQASDVLAMVDAYHEPELVNYYCTHDCPLVGAGITEPPVHRIEPKSISQVTLETINALNRVKRLQEILTEIVEDGTVTEDEFQDFCDIKIALHKLSASVDGMQLWMDKMILEKGIDINLYLR